MKIKKGVLSEIVFRILKELPLMLDYSVAKNSVDYRTNWAMQNVA